MVKKKVKEKAEEDSGEVLEEVVEDDEEEEVEEPEDDSGNFSLPNLSLGSGGSSEIVVKAPKILEQFIEDEVLEGVVEEEEEPIESLYRPEEDQNRGSYVEDSERKDFYDVSSDGDFYSGSKQENIYSVSKPGDSSDGVNYAVRVDQGADPRQVDQRDEDYRRRMGKSMLEVASSRSDMRKMDYGNARKGSGDYSARQ